MNENIIWQSRLTVDMVEDLNTSNLEQLLNELDQAVQEICNSYGIS